jgi:hypothetical protein
MQPNVIRSLGCVLPARTITDGETIYGRATAAAAEAVSN